MPSSSTADNNDKIKDNSESNESNNSSGKRSTAKKDDFLGVDISHWALYAGVGALVVSLVSPIITPKLSEIQNVLMAAAKQQSQQQPQQPDMSAQFVQQQQQTQQQQQIAQQQQAQLDAIENGVPTTQPQPVEQQPHDTRYVVDRDPFGSAVKIPVINRRGPSSISQHDLTRVTVE